MLFWTVVFEKTLESPLDCKEIQPVHPRENQSWIFIGRTDVEAETPILWPPDVKSWLIWKRPWCWETLKVRAEGDDRGWDGWMASPTQWRRDRLPTPVFLPAEFHGQSSLVGYSPWSCKESGMTEWLTHTQGVDVTTGWQMRVPWLWGLFKPISRVFSNTEVQKHQFFSAQLSLYSNACIPTWLLDKA